MPSFTRTMPRIRTLLLLLGDIFVIYVTILATAWGIAKSERFWAYDFTIYITDERTLPSTAISCASILLVLYFLGLYDELQSASSRMMIENLMLVLGFTMIIQALVSYSRTGYEMPRWLMLFGGPLVMVTLSLWRVWYRKVLLGTAGRQRVVLVGNTVVARQVLEQIQAHPELGYEVLCCFRQAGEEDMKSVETLAIESAVSQQIESLKPERIAVSGTIDLDDKLSRQLLSFSMQGIQVENMGDLYENLFGRISVDSVTINQLIFSASLRPRAWVVMTQEIYGRLLAALGLAIAWPFMLLTAVAVRLDSEGPALLRQTRLGRGGKPFAFLKFRSMYVNADALTGPVRAQENDPRITRVGKWIRLTRLDELPQLINVLKGDIFLVGPRPEMPALEAKLLADIPLYPQRHRIKPGITGWAQIHHEPEDSIASTKKKLEYDLYYIKHMGIALDMMILFHTVKAVLLRIGAR